MPGASKRSASSKRREADKKASQQAAAAAAAEVADVDMADAEAGAKLDAERSLRMPPRMLTSSALVHRAQRAARASQQQGDADAASPAARL